MADLNATKGFDDATIAEGNEEDDSPDPEELAALWEAVREGDQSAIDEMLVGDEEHPPLTGVTVDIADEAGMTPLHWLIVEGHVSVAQWLIDEAQADVDSRDQYGQTPLHHAAVKGHATLVQLLLSRDADPMSRDLSGWTPMHAAARSGFTDAALELLKAVEPATQRASALQRELERSAGFEAERVAKQLREAEDCIAMLDAAGPRGDTPLHRAAHWGHASMVEVLLANGAPPSQLNRVGQRPFDVICAAGERLAALPTLSKALRSPVPVAAAAS